MQMDMRRIGDFIRRNEPYILFFVGLVVYGIVVYLAVKHFEVWHGC